MSVGAGQDRIELRQSTGNILQLPILIAVVVLAVVISEVARGVSWVVLGVCGAGLALDALFTAYLLRNLGSTLVVTADAITFTKKNPAPPQVIERSGGSELTFRVAANGPTGMDYTGYALKLRQAATGNEVYAGAFGRSRVVQACKSQGWTIS